MLYQNEISKFLDNYSKEKKIFGSFQLYFKGEKFKYNFGYADLENNTLIDSNTKFRYYSITKGYTAIALMILYEKGLVDLYAHPSKYLDFAKNIDGEVTIYNLLTHTSGLNEITTKERYSSNAVFDVKKLIEQTSLKGLKFKAGTQTDYCNTNFLLIALLIEKISGISYERFVFENILKPLNMNDTLFGYGDCIDKLAVGYDKDADGNLIPASYVNMRLFGGAGGLVGTVDDLFKLYDVIKNKTLLKPETWEMVFTPSNIGDGGTHGFGNHVFDWDGNGKIFYQYNGGADGFRTLHRILPNEDMSIIILSNCGFGNIRKDVPEFIYSLFFGGVENSDTPVMDKGFAIK